MPLEQPPDAASYDRLADDEIVRHVLNGNAGLFELLMRRYNERVYRAARAILRNEQETEEAMQQAYLNAFAHLHQFRHEARFATWLLRIVVNEALARARRGTMFEHLASEPSTAEPRLFPRTDPDPEGQAIAGELRTLLERAIDTLPDGMREVFVLRDVEGMSTAEVAAALAVSVDVVKTRLSRSRAALRRVLLERTGATVSDAFRFYRPRCDRVVALVAARITHQLSPFPAPTL